MQLNYLTTFQSFGGPYSICDEEAVDIAYGEMLRDDFDIHDKLNYSVISVIPTEIYCISKSNFLSFVREPTLSIYKSNLITLHPDWVLRKSYVNNSGWQSYKKDFVDFKI